MNIKFLAVIVLASLGVSSAEGTSGHTLNACDKTKVNTSGWNRVAADSSMTFLLPASFKADTSADQTQHGSRTWKSGKTEFYGEFGHWGANSWPNRKISDTHSECEASIDGHKVLLMTDLCDGHYSATVWFKDLGGSHMSSSLGGNGVSNEDQGLFLAIIRTVKIKQ